MMLISNPELKVSHPTLGYMPVQVSMLRRLKHSAVDLFVQYEVSSAPVLYYRAGCPMEAYQALQLSEAGVQQIYVVADDFHRFAADLLQMVDSQSQLEDIPAAERFAALQLAMAVEIEHAARLLNCGPFVAAADKLGRDLTALLVGNNVLPSDLFRLARHDFSTFAHVTNVASYAVIFAEKLALCDESEFESIAKAAILHDIGKRFIPSSILAKPAKLDAEERAIIESHPQRGYEELCGRDDMSHAQLMLVYQHHERFDGQGYPVGSLGEEIHPWARMLTIVDVFDAMTGTRPYRRPALASEALAFICKNAGSRFDPEMVSCWNSIMSKG